MFLAWQFLKKDRPAIYTACTASPKAMVSQGRKHGPHLSCPPTLRDTTVESDQVLTDNPHYNSERLSHGSISQGAVTHLLLGQARVLRVTGTKRGWQSHSGSLVAAVRRGRAAFLPWGPSRLCSRGAMKGRCKCKHREAGCSRRAGRTELQPCCNPCRWPCHQLAQAPASATQVQPGFPPLTANSWGKATS